MQKFMELPLDYKLLSGEIYFFILASTRLYSA
jgi:hypothetical protein